jgi:subtilisin family serine protease
VSKCDPSFWKAVDNTEYAGVAVIFIAGNEGSRGAESLRTPGDRIASPVNVFSVGALNPDQKTIASFSSRGPSGCDHQTIKPEVCAQGASVRSCHLSGTYRILSGTSMACPHVAGGVALLREVWPHVTAQRVKEILLATADDLGPTGEDNSYGTGRINLLSAYQQLVKERPAVSLSVMGTVRQYKEGQVIRGHVVLMNTTQTAQKARVSLEFRFDGAPTGLVIVPPVDIGIPPGFTNEAVPLIISMPVPTGLPAAVLDPKKWTLRGEVRPTGGGSVLHASEYEFSLTR